MAQQNSPEAKTDLVMDEAIAKGWEVPEFTIKEIRDAIPAHCFRRDTFRSFTYVLHDFFFIALLAYGASWIDTLSSTPLRYLLWSAYWVAQGIVGTGIWVIGHECGHQAFSPSKAINDGAGMVLHSLLLVPYYSWKFSHSKHHKATGHLTRDMVFVPKTRSERGLPPRDQDPELDGPHTAFDESPIAMLFGMFKMLSFGWIYYLLVDVTGQPGKTGWSSHFNPNCYIFEKDQFSEVMQSTAALFAVISGLAYAGQVFGSLAVIKYYVIPYFFVNGWLVLITYLQHTDPTLPHYTAKAWNFQRGAALTIDRSYGFLLNHFHHHISDTHVAHHFFSTMPHYHGEEATEHIKKALGKHYHYDPTPIAKALANSWTQCRFIEDDGDVRFFKN
ncbi:delta-12-fatty acid desaturase [Phycomyces nitens]|nr:delta-12-fatty acid desaturase [Phycomyces nitens]